MCLFIRPSGCLGLSRIAFHLVCLLLFAFAPRQAPVWAEAGAKTEFAEWRTYGGSSQNIRYSTLDQINRDNVSQLELAWSYETGDSQPGSEMQCNPIMVDGVLYLTTPKLRLDALDAATGQRRWRFDPFKGQEVKQTARNRGLVFWREGGEQRLFFVARQYLYAIQPANGQAIASFGKDGRIDLREGLGREPSELSVSANTPGVIYQDLLILGSLVGEDLPAAPGDIRAYDVRTGALRWSFHTIPHPGELGYETWPNGAYAYVGGANNWCGMAVDHERGLVFAPTGSASFDFYGGNRLGDNLFANCLLALNAATGERVWHFQAVHHDILDRDFPSPPSLVTVQHDGRRMEAVAQTSKQGYVFLFERSTGKPLFPIEERKVPCSDVEGEVASPTQPFPLKPPPFARTHFTEDLVTARTPEARRAVLERFRKLRSDGPYAPPSLQGTVIFPGLDGAAEWGGSAYDPDTGLLYVNSNEMAWIIRLEERQPLGETVTGKTLYLWNCSSCHRSDFEGTPPRFPSLVDIAQKKSSAEITRLVREGNGLMPAFTHLNDEQIHAVVSYLRNREENTVKFTQPDLNPVVSRFRIDGYNKFLDPEGYPAVKPPWGTLNAINLNTGQIAWSIPFGEYPALAAKGMTNTGSENYGGPIVTTGGLLFIGATVFDRKFHAYDKSNGQLLWETVLPAGGTATPATYMADGRQFVVIAAGGGKCGTPSGGTYQAFALPKKSR